MKVYVDANPTSLTCVPEEGEPHLLEYLEQMTNNEAEYKAIIWALGLFPEVTEILSDSQLAVNQLNYKWSIKEDRLRALAKKVHMLAKGNVKFTWIPREKNPAGRMLG